MRPIQFAALITTLSLATSAFSSSDLSREKVKTGILPSGDFYSIYNVDCGDGRSTQLATVDGRRSWCMADGVTLDCFRAPQLAATRACAAQQLELARDGDDTNTGS